MKYTFNRQAVFHTGTSMVVAKEGEKHEVPSDLLANFIADGTIKDPDGKSRKVETGDADDDGDRDPAVGDTVTHSEGSGGWHTITASWLADPIKVRGDDKAADKLAELEALIPAGDGEGAPVT